MFVAFIGGEPVGQVLDRSGLSRSVPGCRGVGFEELAGAGGGGDDDFELFGEVGAGQGDFEVGVAGVAAGDGGVTVHLNVALARFP